MNTESLRKEFFKDFSYELYDKFQPYMDREMTPSIVWKWFESKLIGEREDAVKSYDEALEEVQGRLGDWILEIAERRSNLKSKSGGIK
jgi:hypothetical protein